MRDLLGSFPLISHMKTWGEHWFVLWFNWWFLVSEIKYECPSVQFQCLTNYLYVHLIHKQISSALCDIIFHIRLISVTSSNHHYPRWTFCPMTGRCCIELKQRGRKIKRMPMCISNLGDVTNVYPSIVGNVSVSIVYSCFLLSADCRPVVLPNP